MIKKEFDFDQFRADALKAMYAGKPLTGKDGVLAPLIENLLNAALEGEMDSHLSTSERESGNRRNGHMCKQVQSSVGELTIQTPPRPREQLRSSDRAEARAYSCRLFSRSYYRDVRHRQHDARH